jgi:uncharacterized membrane protein
VPRIEEDIHIERPVADVFAFAHDPDNQTLIASNMLAFDLDAPEMRKGARAEGVTKVAGRRVEWTSEVVEYEEGQRVEIRSVEAPMDFHITWTYEPEGDGTRVRFVQEVPSIGGFFGRLGDPVVTKMYSRDVRSNLEHLKALLEEGDVG